MDFKSYNCAGDWIIERDLVFWMRLLYSVNWKFQDKKLKIFMAVKLLPGSFYSCWYTFSAVSKILEFPTYRKSCEHLLEYWVVSWCAMQKCHWQLVPDFRIIKSLNMCVWQIDILEVEGVYYGTFISSRLYTLLSHVVKDNSFIPGGLMGIYPFPCCLA
jgi:hypothetical protein